MSFSNIETAAILAGLRLLQRCDVLPAELDNILTDGGELPRITESDIDALCEKVSESAPARVVVSMDGGLIQNVSADSPVRLLLVDYDVETADEDRVIEVPQMNAEGEQDGIEDAYVGEDLAELDKRWVDLQFDNWEASKANQDEGEAE